MTRNVTRGNRYGERGFTLVELLVVIVILGILSGVVVFAVRGAGDKGEANAIATDDRIVRTAMEAFCAQYGTYPADMNELVTGPNGGAGGRGFLSEPSEYNPLPSVPAGSGCGGTGGTTSQNPKCDRLKLDGSGMEETVDAESGMWCLAASPARRNPLQSDADHPFDRNRFGATGQTYYTPPHLVQLRNGKVLSIRERVAGLPAEEVLGVDTTEGNLTEIFDPADGPKGSWIDGPVARVRSREANGRPVDQFMSLALIDGEPGECGDRCGHVFAHFAGHSKLYNPETNTWSVIEPQSEVGGGEAAVLQLTGPECAPNCFKLLIVSKSQVNLFVVATNYVELYDPKTNQFEKLFIWSTQPNQDYQPLLAELADGRVVVRTSWYQNGFDPNWYLLDVRGRKVEQGKRDVRGNYKRTPAVLPDGRLLYLEQGNGEIYTPQTGGPGAWTVLKPRSTGNSAGYNCAVEGAQCNILGTLPDDRALVLSSENSNTTRLFDGKNYDVNTQWSDTPFQLNLNTYSLESRGVLIDRRRGSCGMNCDNMLVVGYDGAELYKP